ncbi:MAG: response regulator [Bryobacteraceae bacterium]|jgi:CheY-like chemotaxis protein
MNSSKQIGARGTVLVVDDEPAVLLLIDAILTAADYRVLLAGSGKDAIRLAEQKHVHIDVALLDVRMPGVRPAEMAGDIQSLRPNIPIVFMSGFVDDEIVRIQIMEYDGFLAKPFRAGSLLQVLRDSMEKAACDGGVPGYRAPPAWPPTAPLHGPPLAVNPAWQTT